MVESGRKRKEIKVKWSGVRGKDSKGRNGSKVK